MTVLLMMVLILLNTLHFLQIRKLVTLWQAWVSEQKTKTPPKARKSFVIKRMEERLKEALYE